MRIMGFEPIVFFKKLYLLYVSFKKWLLFKGGRETRILTEEPPNILFTSQITYFASSAFATCAVSHVSEHSTTISVLLTFGFPRDLSHFSLISSAKSAVIVPAWKDLLFI